MLLRAAARINIQAKEVTLVAQGLPLPLEIGGIWIVYCQDSSRLICRASSPQTLAPKWLPTATARLY
jgi:hypothetical protein